MAKVPLIPSTWMERADFFWPADVEVPEMTEELAMLIAEGLADLWNGNTASLEEMQHRMRLNKRRERRRQLREERALAKQEAEAEAAAKRALAVEAGASPQPPSEPVVQARRTRRGQPEAVQRPQIVGLREAPDYAAEWRRRPRVHR